VGSADNETKSVGSKVKLARDHHRRFDQLPTASSVNLGAVCLSHAKENKKRVEMRCPSVKSDDASRASVRRTNCGCPPFEKILGPLWRGQTRMGRIFEIFLEVLSKSDPSEYE
jgi:hypothetical protein